MIIRAVFLFFFIAPVSAVLAQDSHNELAKVKEQELQQVRERINDLKRSMDRAQNDQDRLASELQNIEIEIPEKRMRLKAIEGQRRNTEKKKRDLDVNLVARESYLNKESLELVAQLRAAYMNGSQEKIKLLLNQHDPISFGRLMTYYRFFSDYRAENISAVTDELQKLDELRSRITAEEERLSSLARNWYLELGDLNSSLEERQKLLVNLRKKIADEGQEVGRLIAQEKDLRNLISELTNILSDYPINSKESFTKYNGRLTWPVVGTLVHDFGQSRIGGKIKWNGIVLAAPRGSEVRTVYHGRIAFADWLVGMGLLVIVDHGEGYMTLYGYNETILKNMGDWVAPGDVIATVGDSGGQRQPSLYFELRKDAKPLDPGEWVKRRPGK
ncbi:MAG: peptidoglycan DD-metalloendopeptidase family protein [Woeseiaceae bacterium]|nr:peptidoglycan DD-metalloendopeptidase family protein [Woeseiaceae bacterium]